MTSEDEIPLPKPLFFIGLYHEGSTEQVTGDGIEAMRNIGYDMVLSPISNQKYRDHIVGLVREYQGSTKDLFPAVPPLSPDFTRLLPDENVTSVIAKASAWIDLGSDDPVISRVSRQVLNVEVAYAAFCGVSTVILPPLFRGDSTSPSSAAVSRYADAVTRIIAVGPYLQLLMPLPMDNQKQTSIANSTLVALAKGQSSDTASDSLSPWDAWHHVRSACRYSAKLAIALTIPRLLPSHTVQSRWYAEPLKLLCMPTSSFAPNQGGHPVLSKAHQYLLYRYIRLQPLPWIVISDPNYSSSYNARPEEFPSLAQASTQPAKTPHPAPHLMYLRHLQQSQPPLAPIDRFASGYQDFLQSPLQPLADNLESITYEVFEKDPIKYKWYEDAVALALKDLYTKLQRPIVLAVVGAGRGPLMTRSLLASRSTDIPIEPYAIEKNPNAFVVLQHRNATDPLWSNRVKLVKTDMRAWSGPVSSSSDAPIEIDILVSELLGSFADNELSPECLDGAQHLLHPDHGVSIPQSYTAWITPLSTPRIHADLLHRPASDIHKWDIPYVVMLHQYNYLSYDASNPLAPDPSGVLRFGPSVQQCWEFTHPLPSSVLEQSQARRTGRPSGAGAGQSFAPGFEGGDGWNEHNARRCDLRFSISADGRGVCHGLGGYFETVLYRSSNTSGADTGSEVVELSTNPATMDEKSKDMISWFPIFFPLKTPVLVPDGAQVQVVMERKTDERRVWYTWQVAVWVEIGGRFQRTAVSEVQSSIETACLM